MSSQNTISGSRRQKHVTPEGVLLERGYLYLTPEAWKSLYAASSDSGISASQYIAHLITTDDGTTSSKDSNDTASTFSRN